LFNTSVQGIVRGKGAGRAYLEDGRKIINNEHAAPIISSSMADGDSFEGTALVDAMPRLNEQPVFPFDLRKAQVSSPIDIEVDGDDDEEVVQIEFD